MIKKLLFLALFVFVLSYAVQCLSLTEVFDAIPAASKINSSIKFDAQTRARVMLLTKNMEAWYARWIILANAKKSIDITYFIYNKDIFGKSLMGLLLKKAAKGVKIRIMADARGTKGFIRSFMGSDLMQELVQFPNVQIRAYNPLLKNLPMILIKGIKALLASNHDKIIIVDGKWVIIGGRNISKNYFASPKDDGTVFRDTDVVVNSNKIGKISKIAFDEEFNSMKNYKITKDLFGNIISRKEELDFARKIMETFMVNPEKVPSMIKDNELLDEMCKEIRKYPRLCKMKEYTKKFFEYFNYQSDTKYIYPVKILDKHSAVGNNRDDISNNLVKLMDACKKEIIIQNPYVVITDLAHAALKRANDRGVKIFIHTNSPVSSDSLVTQAIFLRDWMKLLKEMPNMRIFVMKNANKLHAKVFVFDGQVSIVGTYNMDYISQDINSEVVTTVNSNIFAKEVTASIMNDVKTSSVEYKIKVQPDGKIKVIYGPAQHCDESLLKKLKILGFFAKWARKLI
ncbi:phosphatidylserine/phosphatidylglycerophosphate/cardiolipin synthase family protein [bacterium]|nr:phosphatidylserine/phosphatidylglycerophosphate/cardiolipin synthase family protein [bacterium]